MEKFWKNKPLSEFSEAEWESICLRCGKCCVLKMEQDGYVSFFNRVCDGLDLNTGLCTRYQNRLCSSCIKVDYQMLRTSIELLPGACAYRLLMEGKDLPEWHPLVSGDVDSVRKAKKRVIDIVGVHSEESVQSALDNLKNECSNKKWSQQRYEEELNKIFEKYPLEVFEKCPVEVSEKSRVVKE